MTIHSKVGATLFGAVVFFVGSHTALCGKPPQKGNAAKDQAVALESGPVHEAFAAAAGDQLAPSPVVKKAPPKPLREEIPDLKPEGNVQWIGGYWAHEAPNGYVWVSGVWRLPPPGRQWAAGYWTPTKGGYQRIPGFWARFDPSKKDQEITYTPKPPPVKVETPGTPPGPNMVYAPGSWTSSSTGFVWQTGQWIKPPAPGMTWTRPSYLWSPGGYTYSRGYWDHRPERRGWLFAPMRVPSGVRNQPNFVYKATQMVPPRALRKVTANQTNSRNLAYQNATLTHLKNYAGPKLPVSAKLRGEMTALQKEFHNVTKIRRELEAKQSINSLKSAHQGRLPLPRSSSARLNTAAKPTAPTPPKPTGTAKPAGPAKPASARPGKPAVAGKPTGDKPKDKPKPKAGDKAKDKPHEKPKDKLHEKPKDKPHEKPKDKPKPKAGDKAKDKPHEKPKDKPKAGDKAKDKLHEKPKDKPHEKPKDKPHEKPKNKPKPKAGDKAKDKPHEKPKEKPKPKPKAGDKAKDKPKKP